MAAKTGKTQKTLEQTLWEAADKLRGNQEPSEYKHIVLGLVFLKYISDRFIERRSAIEIGLEKDGIKRERWVSFLESRDEYTSHNVFWVPEDARWESIQARAKLPSVGEDIDRAMDIIEKENPSLRGVLPRNYGRDGLDKRRLGELVDLIGSIGFTTSDDHGSDDVLGRVYEYFLGQFAGKETGKDAGAFYTPRWVVRTLVEMLEPYSGRVYDPAAGSGGMFVESANFVQAHGGKRSDISVYGQEFTDTTWKLAKMNMALRGIEADFGPKSADTFTEDLHPDLRADYIIANPPFNVSDWWDAKLENDPRWKFGVPPMGNANFAWAQHIVYHLAPNGRAGFVLANMSLASDSVDEKKIRTGLVEDNLVDCIVTLPDKLFKNTPIAVSLWFLDKGRTRSAKRDVLFIDASKMGFAQSRTSNILPTEAIEDIAAVYRNWRGNKTKSSADSKLRISTATVEQIRAKGYVLLPASYIGEMPTAFDETETVQETLKGLEVEELLSRLELLTHARHRISREIENVWGDQTLMNPVFKVFRLGDFLEQSNETLGTEPEPEVLTCTESSGLVLQRERFAKRVATENTRKYKIVRRGDIVYNPYLLWKGSIDQCRIVDVGITSPAYEVFRIKEGFNPTLIGKILTSARMVQKYDGISFGTVERRRRAAPAAFLNLEIQLPVGEEIEKLGKLLDELTIAQQQSREAERGAASVINGLFTSLYSSDLGSAEALQ